MNKILALCIALVFAAGLYFVYSSRTGPGPVPLQGTAAYSNIDFGISFEYPDTYALREDNVSKAGMVIYNITLTDKEALAAAPPNGEGPPSITIGIYGNSAGQTVDEWVRSNNYSNFQISPGGEAAQQSIAGETGLAYRWDGLFPGRSVVIEHRGNFLMFSVSSPMPNDDIQADFDRLLSTVELI